VAQLIPAEDGTGYVNGEKVGSTNEWYVALALDKLGWDFSVQQKYFGGRAVAGGMVLDFIVYTKPNPTPVFIQGEYWHRRSRGDIDALQVANMRRYFYGSIREPILIQESECETPTQAYETCLKYFGRAS